MKSILITVCLSNDMIAPIKKYECPPHKLHIGYYETRRILGEDFTKGPLMNFIKLSHETDSDKLTIIHTRDWHNLNDPEQKAELEKFGPHCIENSYGAKFIWEDKNLISYTKNNPIIFNSKKIMTVSEPKFIELIKKIIGDTPKEEVKIGIIGVLTNIKVLQMAVGLQGQLDINNIAVCSALTASNNIRKHFEGLEDLSNIYGVGVYNSVASFGKWLRVKQDTKHHLEKYNKISINLNKLKSLSNEEKKVVEYLFKECKSVHLDELSGGFSGSKVFLAKGVDRQNFSQFPTVMKVDKRENIGKERIGFEKIEHVLGPHVPKIIDSIEMDNVAGIRYSFAMMNKKDMPKTFKKYYMGLNIKNKEDFIIFEKSLTMLIEEIFTPLYSNWLFEQKQLWDSNTYRVEFIPFISNNIKKILGYFPNQDKIIINRVGEFFNPLKFYTEENITKRLKEPVSYVRQSLAHGDLNAANILLDESLNMWLIDFFHTGYNYHVIQDIVKLENDLKFIHTPIKTIKELNQVILFEKLLMSQSKLSEEIPKIPKALEKNPNILKLYLAIKRLRKFAYDISKDKEIKNYRIPQLRYACHNLSFDESSKLQKQYALASTSMLCEYFNKNGNS